MSAADLHRIMHNGVLFAAKNEHLPMIEAVRLEFSTDQVVSVATDRFVLGVTRADYSGEAFTTMIDRGDAERLAKLAKTNGNTVRDVSIESVGNTLVFVFTTGESVTVTPVDHEFPKYRQLIPTEQRGGVAGHVAVNPAYLAKFTKVITENPQLTLSLGAPTKPVGVRVGGDFVGLIMPVRAAETSWDIPAWL
ncbi:hypothetical protein [Mycobacterium sp. 94-17]|uniref:hypothetical protein n=1 Tax=Mycobacterium sp. 94-17 TaxID=2986147 RepID=UPI002D1F1626|nr:hypothetical protein [Mycobacterium sp. 94-17]MEB4210960.1 hypothetical protein [Mycobacterium sp. 94-17]